MPTKTVTRIALVATFVMAVSACVPPVYWTKAGATNQSFNSDKLDCTQIAKSTVGSQAVVGSLLFIAAAQASHNREAQEVFSTCMQSRGYLQAQTPTQPQ